MPVDYSKWDALELSDDSDIEVHPNVDKRSFIRAKQNQIHQQRFERRREIDTLKYERIINDGLLERINALLDALKAHQEEAAQRETDGGKGIEELVFQALIESAGDPAKDEPPAPPQGVYERAKEKQPRYSQMMGSLIDQVKKDVDAAASKGTTAKSEGRYKEFIEGVRGHLTKVQNLQQELLTKLGQLEKEESSKITSDMLHDGVNYSALSKGKPKEPSPSSTKQKTGSAGSAGRSKSQETELLNPVAVSGLATSERDVLNRSESAISSGAEADVEDESQLERDDDEESESSVKLTPTGKKFAQIKMGDFKASLDFIGTHYDEIMNETAQDGLLVEAFNAAMKDKQTYAKQCVHQALLIQYCRQLGRDGVGLFFKRVTTKGHQAHTVFVNDVNDTYSRIKTRAAEVKAQEDAEDAEIAAKGGVEQIQLHAVEPGTEIHINVPEANSTDPTEIEARKIFDSFPPGLQRALASGSLDEVNKVLGKMAVDEAEAVVEKLGSGGMLSLQEGVIDATNEEGQRRLKEIEEEEKQRRKNQDLDTGEPGGAVVEELSSSAAPKQESSAYDID